MGKGKRLKNLFKKAGFGLSPNKKEEYIFNGGNIVGVKIDEQGLGNNIIMLLSGEANHQNLIQLFQLYRACDKVIINSKTIDNKYHILISGHVNDYIRIFNNIDNINNKWLLAIREVLYDTDPKPFEDLIKYRIMNKDKFIPPDPDRKVDTYPSTDDIIIVFNQSISTIINSLKDLSLYGDNKFEIKDVLSLIRIGIKYLNISRKLGLILTSSCRYNNYFKSKDTFKCPLNTDDDKLYSIIVKDELKGDVVITNTLQRIGDSIKNIYNQLIAQNLTEWQASSYDIMGCGIDLYVIYSIYDIIDLNNLGILVELFDELKTLVFSEKGYSYKEIKEYLTPDYILNDVSNMTYDDIDEEVEEGEI